MTVDNVEVVLRVTSASKPTQTSVPYQFPTPQAIYSGRQLNTNTEKRRISSPVQPSSHQRLVSDCLVVELNTEGTEAVEVDDITGSGNGAAGDLASADAGQVDPAEFGAAPDAGVQASELYGVVVSFRPSGIMGSSESPRVLPSCRSNMCSGQPGVLNGSQSGGEEELTRGSTAAGAEGAAAAREARETRATENFILKVVMVEKTES